MTIRVCCGGSGVATDGVGGRGTLYGGTVDHSCPKGQLSSRVSLRINKGALVTGDRNPSPTTLGPEGDLLAYVTHKAKRKQEVQELDLHQPWLDQRVSLGLCLPVSADCFPPCDPPPDLAEMGMPPLTLHPAESSLPFTMSPDRSCRVTCDRL